MRVALIQTAAGMKPPSGGYRGNYANLLSLQKHGHTTMQFCWAFKKDILNAVAELKAMGIFDDQKFMSGTTTMLNSQLQEVQVPWCRFTNTHGILCTALDAEIMLQTLPNHLQQLDAATMIEVSFKTLAEKLSLTCKDWRNPCSCSPVYAVD